MCFEQDIYSMERNHSDSGNHCNVIDLGCFHLEKKEKSRRIWLPVPVQHSVIEEQEADTALKSRDIFVLNSMSSGL